MITGKVLKITNHTKNKRTVQIGDEETILDKNESVYIEAVSKTLGAFEIVEEKNLTKINGWEDSIVDSCQTVDELYASEPLEIIHYIYCSAKRLSKKLDSYLDQIYEIKDEITTVVITQNGAAVAVMTPIEVEESSCTEEDI